MPPKRDRGRGRGRGPAAIGVDAVPLDYHGDAAALLEATPPRGPGVRYKPIDQPSDGDDGRWQGQCDNLLSAHLIEGTQDYRYQPKKKPAGEGPSRCRLHNAPPAYSVCPLPPRGGVHLVKVSPQNLCSTVLSALLLPWQGPGPSGAPSSTFSTLLADTCMFDCWKCERPVSQRNLHIRDIARHDVSYLSMTHNI